MWGVWSDLMEVWFCPNSCIFVTERQSIAEAQVLALEHGREMQIAQIEARAAEERSKRSGIVTPNAMQVPGMGTVPIRRGNGNPGQKQQQVVARIPPDARWRARQFDEWWKGIHVTKAKVVDLRG